MNVQFTHPHALWLLIPAIGWVAWCFRVSDVQIDAWRRWLALGLRSLIVLLLVLAIAGVQWLHPREGMNVFFLLDRSDSIPAFQQEAARRYVNEAALAKSDGDRAGVLVFGADSAIESTASERIQLDDAKVLAIVDTDRTDVAAAIRLGTAAFPETGQKRLVLLSDGNENLGDALAALLSARSLGITLDVIPLGADRARDTAVQKLGLPSLVKEDTPFDAKIFIESNSRQRAKIRLYRNDQPLGEQEIELTPGKNLFSFPQQLAEPGFFRYSIQLEADGDLLPQNNQATGFVHVRGNPQILVLSSNPEQDAPLVAALRESQLETTVLGLSAFPSTLAEMQSFDSVLLCNLSAGDLGRDRMQFLASAVRDFGVGLVCIGGDQSFTAGAYRGTPLEEALPLNMELDSKKVLPNGAVALVMHGMEFNNGNQIARDCAQGVLDALGSKDEMGVVLWNGIENWLFELQVVGDKAMMRREIAGMNQGDLPSFQGVMGMAHQGLAASTANLKHMIVFSDGDPGLPDDPLMQAIRDARVTVSTVLISGHFGPERMIWIAEQGGGRFYDVSDPSFLPQIFIKEASIILKTAIIEEPFQPALAAPSELTRGIGADDYPPLQGYVSTTPKTRAELPLLTHKGDPLLAHWQFGLGRAAAFTSDAQARWGRDWLNWARYRQFWTQVTQWSMRRLANADLTSEVTIENGVGHLVVEAVTEDGDYRNFLNLQANVADPKGEAQTLAIEQTGPGRYEATFPAKNIGSYLVHLVELENNQPTRGQVVGTSVNYSPEFNAPEPNINLLARLAELGQGRLLDPRNPADNPFAHGRIKTYQPRDLWEWLIQCAVILFTLDVAVRRIQIDREQWAAALAWFRRKLLFWHTQPASLPREESLAALLARRDQARSRTVRPISPVSPDPSLFRPKHQTAPLETSPHSLASSPSTPEAEPAPEETPPPEPEPTSTASRLLEAKRRARKRMD